MNIATKTVVNFTVTIELDESAARALDAMSKYGVDNFLEVFYQKLGQAYMRPYETGLRNLLSATSATLPTQLAAIDEARKLLSRKP